MSEKKSFIGISLRGLAMGAADVVPGVSGGTIAFITGIYEELLETISGLNFNLLKVWRKEGFKAFWKKSNLSFLLALFIGIGISIVSLSKLISWLLDEYPIPLWSFFFGLIIASVWLVGKTVKKWDIASISGLVLGTIAAYFISISSAAETSDGLLYIFICGMIAICAMILPGISGSFILLLLGAYTTVLGAITGLTTGLKDGDWDAVSIHGLTIGIFLIGCLLGLILFSKLLNWLFKKAHNLTVAILTGFLIGSLNKIWPWKETTETFIKHPGTPEEEVVALTQINISPSSFTELTQVEHQLFSAIIFAISGLILIILIEKLGNRNKGTSK